MSEPNIVNIETEDASISDIIGSIEMELDSLGLSMFGIFRSTDSIEPRQKFDEQQTLQFARDIVQRHKKIDLLIDQLPSIEDLGTQSKMLEQCEQEYLKEGKEYAELFQEAERMKRQIYELTQRVSDALITTR